VVVVVAGVGVVVADAGVVACGRGRNHQRIKEWKDVFSDKGK
jgi:hypothetical protein